MNPKFIRSLTVIFVLFLCLLVIAAGVWFYFNQSSGPLTFFSPPPVIQIARPAADGTIIFSGQGMVLAAEAVSETGLSRVDFKVDGEVVQQHLPAVAGAKFDTPVFIWFGVRSGWHTLGVVAYDLSGRASLEDNVLVGVTAEAGSGNPGGEALPNGEEQPAAQAGGEGVANPPEGGQPPIVPEDPNQPGYQLPPDGQNPPELPAPPQDNPPEVSGFKMLSSVGADGTVTVSALAEGRDDLGVQRLVLNWQGVGADSGEVSVLCAGAQACQIQHDTALPPGEWIFSAQAFDTSGQASLPSVRVVQVLANEGQPPAVADEALDGGALSDWFANHWADLDLNPDFDGFDLGDVWRHLPGNSEDIVVSGDCLTYVVEPLLEGIRHTLTVQCDLSAEEADEYLIPLVDKDLPNTNFPGIQLRVFEWVDRGRTRIPAGQVFTWLDSDATCGTLYHYRIRVVRMFEIAIGYGSRGTLAGAETDVSMPACAQGSMGDVNLRTEFDQGRLRILWDLNGGGIWPADLPPEGVAFNLIRYDLDTQQSEIIYQQNIPEADLQAGGQYSVLDEHLRCGNRHEYMLTGIASNADLGLVSPGWLVRAHASAPELPCPPGSLAAIELHTQPYWINNSLLAVRISMQIPPGFNFPQGDRVELRILSQQQGDNDCDAAPCSPFWSGVEYIPISAQIRQQGLDYVGEDHDANYGGATYIYRLGLFVDNVEVQSGQNFTATLPKAPPPPPDILRVTATNNCPAGVPRCVVVEWAPYEGPDANNIYYAQAARIYVERVVGALDTQRFQVNLGDTRYIDTSPYLTDHQLANGTSVRQCDYSVTYRMVAFDADGHRYGASPLTIQTPDCNAPWNVVEQAR